MTPFAGIESVVFCPFAKQSPLPTFGRSVPIATGVMREPGSASFRLPFLLPHCRASPTHSLTVWSKLAEASVLPSGEKATEETLWLCPLSVASSCLVCASHSWRLVASQEISYAKGYKNVD
jgi:hypothetical protein